MAHKKHGRGTASHGRGRRGNGGWNAIFSSASRPFAAADIWGTPSISTLENLAVSHPIVFHGIQILSTSFLEAPPKVGKVDPDATDGWEDGTPEQIAWIARLLRRPNMMMTFQMFMQCLFQNRVATGRCYIWLWRDGFGEVNEIWPVPTSAVTPVAPNSRLRPNDDSRAIAYYEINLGDGTAVNVKPEDMIDYAIIDARDLTSVVSPLSTIWRELQLDLLAQNYAGEMLINSRPPGQVIKQEDQWSPDQMDHIRKAYEMRFGGGGRGRPFFISGRGSSVETLPGLADQGQPNLQAGIEFRIAQALNVPLAILGAWGSAMYSTYSNMETWERIFAQYTRVPNWLSFGEALNKILPEAWLAEGLEVWFDESGVKALQADAKIVAEKSTALFTNGGITLNEYRNMNGLPAIEDGDYFNRPMASSLVPLDDPAMDLSALSPLGSTPAHAGAQGLPLL